MDEPATIRKKYVYGRQIKFFYDLWVAMLFWYAFASIFLPEGFTDGQ